MANVGEVEELRRVIMEDEDRLSGLEKKEADLIQQIGNRGFDVATSRERLMSERETVSERLRRNKIRLAAFF